MSGLMDTIRNWGSFVKFSHTVFALPFALASMAVAARDNRGWPGWKTFLLILIAMVSARTCAMTFNRIVDRKYDKLNPRTANRHLPTGAITLWSAWSLFGLSTATFFAASYGLNLICLMFAPIALGAVCFYSITKRFTDYTHVWLGIALALSPIGAWLAVKGQIEFWPLRESFFIPMTLALGVVFWLIGFDLIYALQDYEFDRDNGLHSLVVAWGPRNALKAAFIAHLLTWGILMLFGFLNHFRVAFLIGMLIILGCLLLEHWLARRRHRRKDWIQVAFFKLNAFISIVFLIVTLAEVAFPGFRLVR